VIDVSSILDEACECQPSDHAHLGSGFQQFQEYVRSERSLVKPDRIASRGIGELRQVNAPERREQRACRFRELAEHSGVATAI
jgi:hypothetical protein